MSPTENVLTLLTVLYSVALIGLIYISFVVPMETLTATRITIGSITIESQHIGLGFGIILFSLILVTIRGLLRLADRRSVAVKTDTLTGITIPEELGGASMLLHYVPYILIALRAATIVLLATTTARIFGLWG